MISKVYYVSVGCYSGYADTYEEALQMEERFKCYTNTKTDNLVESNNILDCVRKVENTDVNCK